MFESPAGGISATTTVPLVGPEPLLPIVTV